MNDRDLTIKEAAKELNIGYDTMRRMVERRDDVYRYGTNRRALWRVPMSVVERIRREHRNKPNVDKENRLRVLLARTRERMARRVR
jgi:excisionase family DNA binding protein